LKNNEERSPGLDDLETILQYEFGDRALLERAITHRSWAHEQMAPGAEEARRLHNEALEFLGDSFWVWRSRINCAAYPSSTEGELSRMKHRLVSPTLAVLLCDSTSATLRLARRKSGGRRKDALLADVFEAVTGYFLDGGLAAAAAFIERALLEEFEKVNPVAAAEADYKTMLQERLQAERKPAPRYTVIETAGPPHKRIFLVELIWDRGSVRAEGRSIKSAEAEAARQALEIMRNE
jgi:ribonuclease-3